MSGISYHRDTITRVRAGLADDGYGNQVSDWSAATRSDLTGYRLQPETGGEYVLDREAVTTRWRLFGPDDGALKDTDRIEHQGFTYDIEGSIERHPSPTGRLAHIEARLRRTEG